VEQLACTPSRAAGISAEDERVERFEACDFARNLVRELFNSEKAQEGQLCNDAQVLACYYLQLFYMFQSLTQENSRVVATAAAFLACKVIDLPRRMRSLLKALNLQRVKLGEAEFGEEEQRRTCEKVVRIEFMLVRIISFDFDLALPPAELGRLTEKLLAALVSHSEAFRKACAGRPPTTEADGMRQELVRIAERFTFDSFMGLAPLLAPPRFVAAGALAIATRYMRREMVMSELLQLLAYGDSSLGKEEMKHVIDEILNVFRTKNIRDARRAAQTAPGKSLASASANALATSTCTEQPSSANQDANDADGLRMQP